MDVAQDERELQKIYLKPLEGIRSLYDKELTWKNFSKNFKIQELNVE